MYVGQCVGEACFVLRNTFFTSWCDSEINGIFHSRCALCTHISPSEKAHFSISINEFPNNITFQSINSTILTKYNFGENSHRTLLWTYSTIKTGLLSCFRLWIAKLYRNYEESNRFSELIQFANWKSIDKFLIVHSIFSFLTLYKRRKFDLVQK